MDKRFELAACFLATGSFGVHAAPVPYEFLCHLLLGGDGRAVIFGDRRDTDTFTRHGPFGEESSLGFGLGQGGQVIRGDLAFNFVKLFAYSLRAQIVDEGVQTRWVEEIATVGDEL